MTAKIAVALLLAIFVALATCESPPSLTRIEQLSGAALTTDKVSSIIQMSKQHLATELVTCQENMHLDRVRVQTNPGPLYMVYINVGQCAGSAQPSTSCRVDVLDIRSPSPPSIHTYSCPPSAETK